MKVWVTKSLFTHGIRELEVEQFGNEPSIVSATIDGYQALFNGQGNDWHLSLKDAQFKAEQMRQSKIKSLNKQISKLTQLKF
jgi:hypothetical protein